MFCEAHKKHVHNVLHTNNVHDTQVCVIKTYEECGWGLIAVKKII